MEKDNNQKKIVIIVLIILILLLLAVVFYFLFFFKWPGAPEVIAPKVEQKQEQPKEEAEIQVEEDVPSVIQAEVSAEPKAEPASSAEITQSNLRKMASSFAERFGSYSNQSNYGNITDLELFMTEKMQAWAKEYVATAEKENTYSGIYQGTVTRSISSEMKSFNDSAGAAEVLVMTQKVQSTGDMKNASTYYEDIIIIFAKENGAWKVDSAKWQGKKTN